MPAFSRGSFAHQQREKLIARWAPVSRNGARSLFAVEANAYALAQ
jgi:hypothetical protein